MKLKFVKTVVIMLVLLLLFQVTFSVSAEVPYESYTYWSDVSTERKDVYNRSMYDIYSTYSADDIGVSEFTKVNNIATDTHDNIYILDSNSRIIVLDKNYDFVKEIGLINGTENYNDARSVTVDSDGTIYICDTENGRILHIDANGKLIEKIGLPESPLIPEDFKFRPMSLRIDSKGSIYVLSDGSYYGALLYDVNKQFLGFYGANDVSATITSVLSNIKNRMFPNNVKKGNMAQRLPYCATSIDICDDFVYLSNGYTAKNQNKGQIRKLSAGTGTNILKSEEVNFVDTDLNETYKDGKMAMQDILDLAVDSNGFIYSLESAYGRIFLYDEDCRILTAFGGGMGTGSKNGTFVTVSGMELVNDGEFVIVSDSETNLVTVFKITEFGYKVKNAINLTLNGKYSEIKSKWEEVYALDSNFQPTYSGLARAYLYEKDYKTAMEFAKKGYDRETYAVAFEGYRKNLINENFEWIFVLLILIIGIIIALILFISKKKIKIIKNHEVKLLFSSLIHPSDTFCEIKEKKRGSIKLSIIVLLMFYIVSVLSILKGGFMFTIYDAETFNSFFTFVRTVGLVVLWVVSNWMVCTLLGGKGKLREIIIVTCYSLLPLIFEKIISIFLTNTLLPTEAEFLNILHIIAILYFILLMIIGLINIHDFTMTRLLGTSVLSVLGVGIVVFLIIMLAVMFQQFGGFIMTIFTEITTL